MIHSYTRLHDSEDTLVIEGTPDELEADDALGFVDVVAGLSVTKVTSGGKHDGHPAHIITLADDCGAREIGRLIVRSDVDQREEVFTWERMFDTPDQLEAWIKFHERHEEIKKEIAGTEIASTVVSFCWENYPTLEHGMAATAAEYGVSITKHSMNGGDGGWPEMKVVGLRANVERLLREGWQYSDEMIAEDLD